MLFAIIGIVHGYSIITFSKWNFKIQFGNYINKFLREIIPKVFPKTFKCILESNMIKSWENLHTSIPHNSSQTILREYDHFHEDRGHAKLLPQLRDPLLMYLVPTASCKMIKMLRFNAAMFVICRQWLTYNIVFSSTRSWGHQQISA